MVLYTLYVKATLEGIESLSIIPNTNICISVRNPLDHNEIREKIVIDPNHFELPTKGSHDKHHKGNNINQPYNLAIKWQNTNTHTEHVDNEKATIRIYFPTTTTNDNNNQIDYKHGSKGHAKEIELIMNKLKSSLTHTDSMTGQFIPMLLLDCNNCEPYIFHPLGNEFQIIPSHNPSSNNPIPIDLVDGDWSDYDLASGSISVTHLETKWE